MWAILITATLSDWIFGLLFYSFWTIPAIILVTFLFMATYERIEEKYLEHAWRFDWERYASRSSVVRNRLGQSDYKLARVVFFHRFAYALVFLVLLTSFLARWNLNLSEFIGHSSDSSTAVLPLLYMAIPTAFIFIGFYQEPAPWRKSILERLTGDRRKWRSRVFLAGIILITLGVFILSRDLENTFMQEVATTFTITAGLYFIASSYPRTIRFLTRKKFDDSEIDPIVRQIQSLLAENRDIHIYHQDNMHIRCSKNLLLVKKLCKRSDCDCHLLRADLDMIYILRSGRQRVSKSKWLFLSQSKLRICLKRFLGEAATAVEDFQISKLTIK